MSQEDLPARDPRWNPPQPEVRNLRPPKPDTYEPEDDEPWEALEPVLSPFQAEQTQHILETIEDAFQHDQTDLESVTWRAYEALAEAANAELREIVTRMHHVIELGLNRTDHPQPALTRESAHLLLESLEHASQLLDAHLTREAIAKRFLQLSHEPFDLSNVLREKILRTELRDHVELWLDPSPVEGDQDRLVSAILALAEHLHEKTESGTVGIRLSWKDDAIIGFIGTTEASITQARLASALTQPATMQQGDIDLPLARAIFEHHEATLLVQDLDDAWTGYRFHLPALGIENPLS